MPTHYRLDRDAKAIYIIHSGLMTDAEALRTAQEFAEVELEPGTVMIVDMRAVTQLRLTTEGMLRVIELFRGNPRVTRCAVVAGSDLALGATHMYQALRTDAETEMRAFRDEESALEWLGLS